MFDKKFTVNTKTIAKFKNLLNDTIVTIISEKDSPERKAVLIFYTLLGDGSNSQLKLFNEFINAVNDTYQINYIRNKPSSDVIKILRGFLVNNEMIVSELINIRQKIFDLAFDKMESKITLDTEKLVSKTITNLTKSMKDNEQQ